MFIKKATTSLAWLSEQLLLGRSRRLSDCGHRRGSRMAKDLMQCLLLGSPFHLQAQHVLENLRYKPRYCVNLTVVLSLANICTITSKADPALLLPTNHALALKLRWMSDGVMEPTVLAVEARCSAPRANCWIVEPVSNFIMKLNS
jgi:hypothetical protein